MGAADLLVARDVGDIDPDLDDVADTGAGTAELVLDLAEDLDRLVVGVSPTTEPSGATEVVPPTITNWPARATREKPNWPSNGDGGSPGRRMARSLIGTLEGLNGGSAGGW